MPLFSRTFFRSSGKIEGESCEEQAHALVLSELFISSAKPGKESFDEVMRFRFCRSILVANRLQFRTTNVGDAG